MFGLGREQDGPETMDVACHHRQGDVAFEPVETVIEAAVKTMRLQGVDGGLHRALAGGRNLGGRNERSGGYRIYMAPSNWISRNLRPRVTSITN